MADLREAMRSKNVPEKEAIRMVRAAIKNAEIDKQREATDDEVLAIIAREARRCNEAVEMFRKGRREDLVAKEEAQLDVLRRGLPRQLSREEIEQVVQRIIAESGATGMGQLGPVMRQAMA